MTQANFNIADFEQEWTDLAGEICQHVYTQPDIQKMKTSLQKKGYLTLEEKSQFIDVCDQTKYDIIYKKYGPDGSEGYKEFSEKWAQWFQQKGVESQKDREQRSSVDHILFGSTPDPEPFLLHFEEEIMGSMRERDRE